MVTIEHYEPALSRRERKKRMTRQNICKKAIELFRSEGYENVTIGQIAAAADVDTTTFWRHFGSKNAILFMDLDDWLDTFRATLSRVPDDMSPVQGACWALAQEPCVGDPEMAQLRFELAGQCKNAPEFMAASLVFEERSREEMTEAIAEWMDVDPEKDVTPAILASSVFGAASWLRSHLFVGGKNLDKLDSVDIYGMILEAFSKA